MPHKETTMAMPIKKLRGIDAELEGDLRIQGIYNTGQLLSAARTPAERERLAGHAGVEARTILELANRADLARIPGVAGVYSDLLEQAGVDTVRELAVRNPSNLHAKMVELNAERGLAGRVPSRDTVGRWIEQAAALPRRIEY
jgi:predicted flap endonuclease-1-like 5' DNA nuclease